MKTHADELDEDEASRLNYLLHLSLDSVDEKVTQQTSKDNFLGNLYQCEQFKIYGLITTTKIKILCIIDQKTIPRENDIRQMLKSIQKAYIEATAMNPFYKPSTPVQSKRLDDYLKVILTTPADPMLKSDPSLPENFSQHS